MNKLLGIILSFFLLVFSTSVKSELGFGFDLGGLSISDSKVDPTVAKLDSLSGTYVTSSYDTEAILLRAYLDAEVISGVLTEVGIFQTSNLSATYTIDNNSASESYDVNGLDAAFVFKGSEDGFFIKGGAHYSSVNGASSVTINGTDYDISSTSTDGVGILFGGGMDISNYRTGFTYYSGVGGTSDAYLALLYVGFRF